MTQLGGRGQWAQVWTVVSSALASAVPAEVAQQHLATEAVVAYVDGELSIAAHERAIRHLSGCTLCTAEVAAQRQARSAVRCATPPAMSASLLAALHAIPHSAELPPGPEVIAVSENGEFVVAQRRPHRSLNGPVPARSPSKGSSVTAAAPLGLSAPLGSGARLGSTGLDGSSPRTSRRVMGAGVVVSGLVLGALALSSPGDPVTPGSPRPGAETGSVPVPAQFQLDRRGRDASIDVSASSSADAEERPDQRSTVVGWQQR
jgi:hypothetical protein